MARRRRVLQLTLDRWYLALLGLAMMREYPFGDVERARRRTDTMSALLERRRDAHLFETRDYEVLDPDEAYEAWSRRYDEPNPLIAVEEPAFAVHLDRQAIGRALDVATGTGRVAAQLAARGHRVIACDRSDAMLRIAAEKLDRIPLVRSDITSLPFSPASVDLLTCALALTQLTDLAPAVSEFARVVRPGGAAVISDVHPSAVLLGTHAFFRRADETRAIARNEQHLFSGYVTAAVDAGFAIEACTEVPISTEVLDEFGVDRDPMHPERAVLGLPFALILTLRRR